MKFKEILCLCLLTIATLGANAQVKILFDNVKGETTGNTADWTIDAPVAYQNLCWSTNGSGYTGSGCYHSNPQQTPLPAQSGITASTPETFWTGALSNWGIDMVKQGYTVESLPYNGAITYGNAGNAQDLSHYKVFIMCEPNTHMTSTEKTAILNFVQNGGGLYMISDHNNSDRNGDGWDSPHIWLDFMTTITNAFGVKPDTVTVSPTTTSFPSLPNDSCLHGPLGTVTGIKYHSGTTFTIYPAVNPNVVAIAYSSGTSGTTNVIAGHSRYGRGKIAFLGDSSPCDDGTGNTTNPSISLTNSYTADENGSHRKLLVNSTIWLASTDAAIQTSADTTMCSGSSVTLTASGATSYSWSPGGATTASITVSPSATTTYTVTGMVNGSPQSQNIIVTVLSPPTAAFTTSVSGHVVSTANQSVGGSTYTWNFGDGTANVSGQTPTHTYTLNNTYTVTLTASNICGYDTVTHSVTINSMSVSPAGGSTVCAGQPATLTASGAASYSWAPGGATTAAITVTPATTTTYTVTGMVNNSPQTQTITVTVQNRPAAGFSTSVSGYGLTVGNQTQNGSSYVWNFGDQTATVNGITPTHTYAINGTYTVTLIATNSCGSDTVSHFVTINVNGIDETKANEEIRMIQGADDLKLIYPATISTREVRIYSVSGQEVLKVNDTNDQNPLVINISGLPKGIYILKTSDTVKKFSK